jgi:histidine kinase
LLFMLALAGSLTLAEQPQWGFLFIYCAASSALITNSSLAFAYVSAATALGGGLSAIAGGSGGTAISFAASGAGVGLLMMPELAGRLLPGDPERAAGEIADVEAVARTALSDVRQAVSGYRQPTLDGELAGARMALSAAGVECEIDRTGLPGLRQRVGLVSGTVAAGPVAGGGWRLAVTVPRVPVPR